MYLARRHAGRIVHVHHGYRSHEVMGMVRRLQLPYVLSLHGHDITGAVEAHPDRYDAATRVVDAVIVPSAFLAGIAAAVGFPEDRVHVVPTGVDTTVFTPTPLPDGTPVLLFVGRFVEKKGLDVLLAAWPAVRNQVPGARLRLLGFGPLEGLARSGGEGVEVVLRPNQEEVRTAIRQAHVVVSPSRTAVGDSVESLLIVNLEAQASGRPVVTTRHGGIPEFVLDGETSLVVPENDPRSLAAALSKVLTDRSLAERLAAAGPAWASRFDARRCAARVDDLYGSLMSSPRRRVITSR
jgi:glycosyltransferase involved in cell wall biosynthesis